MDNIICLDKNYSTNKLLTKEKPKLEQKPEYKLEQKLFLSAEEGRHGEGGLRTKGWFKKSYENKPLMSVVTVVYNGEKHLEQTIKSVIEQSYDNVEYIVIDGGSTDGTQEIIKKHEEQIDYWVSEPDGGIYDAMNKGISLSVGDYVSFLNADDWYNNDTLALVVQTSEKAYADYIIGHQDVYKSDKYFNTFKVNMKSYRRRVPFGHPSLFVRRNLLLEYGFDQSFLIVADYDFMLKVIKRSRNFRILNTSLSNFRLGGVSTTANIETELFEVRRKHFGSFCAYKTHVQIRFSNLLRYILHFGKQILIGKRFR